MMTNKVLVFAILASGLTFAEKAPYKPRGWQPDGRSFDPAMARQKSYYGPPPPLNSYGPQNEVPVPPITEPSIPRPLTTTTEKIMTTTTPRSREPTTPFSEEDVAVGPALAVANSFAFNRPIYVYNSFPYYSGYTVLK